MAKSKQQYDEGIGKRIKEARIKRGLSRQQLANLLVQLSVSQKDQYQNISGSLSSVKSWEGIGRKYSPDRTTLKALSEILEVDFEWLLHGTTQDIIKTSLNILQDFTPTEKELFKYQTNAFLLDGKEIPNEVSEKISLLYPLIKNGYKPSDISDEKQFCEYMESSTKNSIEFYMKNINKRKDDNL